MARESLPPRRVIPMAFGALANPVTPAAGVALGETVEERCGSALDTIHSPPEPLRLTVNLRYARFPRSRLPAN